METAVLYDRLGHGNQTLWIPLVKGYLEAEADFLKKL
jgi:hypothetical protein